MSNDLLITVPAAVVPALLLLWYFYATDKHPEPGRVVLTTFFLGVLCVIPVLAVALPMLFLVIPTLALPGFGPGAQSQAFGMAFLSAAGPEEFFKWLVLVLYCARHKEFNEPMDGIVYGATASLGFATLENVMYVGVATSSGLDLGLAMALGRAISAVPAHACLGAIMGYYVGRAHFRLGYPPWEYFLSLMVPIMLHGLYDYGLMLNQAQMQKAGDDLPNFLLIGFSYATLLVMIIWAVVVVRRARAEQHRGAH